MIKAINPISLFILAIVFALLIFITGCTPSNSDTDEKTETETTETTENTTELSGEAGTAIMTIAKQEQLREMYSPAEDSTYLYWLNNKLILLNHATKCNIYALNTLFKAGFKTPTVNALTRDLVDTSRFKDILPVIAVSDPRDAKTGDLIVWNGHVIIFESLFTIRKSNYAKAWWAGTRQKDNGENILNNVIYGNYKLSGYYVVRRPVKK